MKESIRTLAPQFSTRRMLTEYLGQAYFSGKMDEGITCSKSSF